VIANFPNLPDNIRLNDVLPIAKLINDEYVKENYDQVLIAYTDFVSALSQKPRIRQILPVSTAVLDDLKTALEEGNPDDISKSKKIEYLIEEDIATLTEALAEKITKMQVYQMILESNASEQSARMMAMKNASEASGEMIEDLTLMFNKARQSNITREISEISAGMTSVS
jgi:F-type H+-transporting ATPase subunit gamma